MLTINPFVEGKEAALSMKMKVTCPYNMYSFEGREWLLGYEEGKKVMGKK